MRQAWPFLLTKSLRQDYFTVLCPQYIIKQGLQKQLRIELNRLSREETVGLQTKVLRESSLGKVTILYRCDRAQVGGVDLRDAQDRPVVRVYGVVIKGLHYDIVELFETGAENSLALEQIEKAFADLCSNPSGFDTRPSSPITIPGGGPFALTGVGLNDILTARNQIVPALIGLFIGAVLVYLSLTRPAEMRQAELVKTQGELVQKIKFLETKNEELQSQVEKMTRLVGPTPSVAAPP
jgi:hypothetical protein